MLRRIVSLILVPTVLLTQWASAAHGHGCQHSSGHDHTPHIHLSWFTFIGSGREAQDETPDGCRCCDHADCVSSACGYPVPQTDSSTDHDADVIYLPTWLSFGWTVERSSSDPSVVHVQATEPAVCAVVQQHGEQLLSTHDPPRSLNAVTCPIYLLILTLVI